MKNFMELKKTNNFRDELVENVNIIKDSVSNEELVITDDRGSKIVDFYLIDEIEDFKNYIAFNRAIDSLKEGDIVKLHINCYGGQVNIASQIYDNLKTSPARVVVFIEGVCMSAASFFPMIADEVYVSPSSTMMIHSYSAYFYGKAQELMAHSKYIEKWFSTFVHKVYKDFLTEEEINSVIDGKDIYLDAEEMTSRFNKITEDRENEYKRLNEKENRIQDKMQAYFDKIYDEEFGDKDELASKPGDEKTITVKPKSKRKSKKNKENKD